MGYNLLVFASSSERLAFCSFVFFGLLRVWTAAGRLFGIHQNPWVDPVSSRIFLRSDASRHQLGTFVGISFLRRGGIIRLDDTARPFRRLLRISLVLLSKVDTGYPLSPWLDDDKGGLATSVMPLRLPYCNARNEEEEEEEEEEAALLSKSRLWRGIEGKDL